MTTKLQAVGPMACAALLPVVGCWPVAEGHYRFSWMIIAALMVAMVMLIGKAINNRVLGIFIDGRNVMSLSRFQMTIWTLIVVSAYLTAAFHNVSLGIDEPLGIGIPKELWMAMGISTTSLVGTPMILEQKKRMQTNPQAVNLTVDQLQQAGQPPGTTTVQGQVLGNLHPVLAKWSDMFTGDDTTNGAQVDLSKVQMFLFTLVIAVSYCYALWKMFTYAPSDGITEFPFLDDSTVALLGISHAAYLFTKAVPKAQTGEVEVK